MRIAEKDKHKEQVIKDIKDAWRKDIDTVIELRNLRK